MTANVLNLDTPKLRLLRDMHEGEVRVFRALPRGTNTGGRIAALVRDLDGRWATSVGWFIPPGGEPVQLAVVECLEANTVARRKPGRRPKETRA